MLLGFLVECATSAVEVFRLDKTENFGDRGTVGGFREFSLTVVAPPTARLRSPSGTSCVFDMVPMAFRDTASPNLVSRGLLGAVEDVLLFLDGLCIIFIALSEASSFSSRLAALECVLLKTVF